MMKFIHVLVTVLLGARAVFASVGLAGVNIAGADFGMNDYGYCGGQGEGCPNATVAHSQLFHFSLTYRMYLFRLPVAWQFLVNRKLGGALYQPFFKNYDYLVRTCLATGSYCIIDIHNYARWEGNIIGQSGSTVTNAHFTSLWSQLAQTYKNESKIIFGIMNEPHDLDMNIWAQTCQQVVNTIRAAGAKSQLILLPGSNYATAQGFDGYSGPILNSIKDYDGSNNMLIFDVHQYYTSSGGGEAPCASNKISEGYGPLATFLRQNNRYAMVTETGGYNNAACVTYVCQALDYINANSDVYMGWVGWGAGNFSTSYVYSETPFSNGTDQLLVQKCIGGKVVP